MSIKKENNLRCETQPVYATSQANNSTKSCSNQLKYYGDQKIEKSHDFFKSTRVNSCSYVKIDKGISKAVGYYAHANQSFVNKMGKSEHNQSLSHFNYKVRPNMRVGMAMKPLVPYTPNSYRNRLPVKNAPKLSKNLSQIEIGDRGTLNRKQFLSSCMNTYGNFGKNIPVSNTGIISEITKWHHKQQMK